MSTKNKKIVYYLAAFLVVLMLVCTCLLGSTFARYTSSSSGKAAATIAKWSFSGTYQTGTYGAEVGSLSPAQDPYDYGISNTERSHSTAAALVATLANNSAVDANVTFSIGDFSYTDGSGGTVTLGTNDASYDSTATTLLSGAPSNSQLKSIFSVSAALYTDNACSTEASGIKQSDGSYTLSANSATSYYVGVVVTWTSYDYEAYSSDPDTAQAYADTIDTWIGENITYIVFDVNYTAVQDSELPA